MTKDEAKFVVLLLILALASAFLSSIITNKYYHETDLQPFKPNQSTHHDGIQDKTRYYADYLHGDYCRNLSEPDKIGYCLAAMPLMPLSFQDFSFVLDFAIFLIPSLIIYFASKSRLASVAWMLTFICLMYANGGLYSQFLSTIPFLVMLFCKPKELWKNALLILLAFFFHIAGGFLILLLFLCRREEILRHTDFFFVHGKIIPIWKFVLAFAVVIFMLPRRVHVDMLFPIPFGVIIEYANVGFWMLCWIYPILYIARKASSPRHKPELLMICLVLLTSLLFAVNSMEISFWRVLLVVELLTLYIVATSDIKPKWNDKEWLWLIAMQTIRITATFMLGMVTMPGLAS